MTWKPIETAPRDGTEVDIWVRPPIRYPRGQEWRSKYDKKEGRRYTDCKYDKANDSWTKGGKWIVGRREVEEFDPSDKSEEATVATHWHPLPPPPED